MNENGKKASRPVDTVANKAQRAETTTQWNRERQNAQKNGVVAEPGTELNHRTEVELNFAPQPFTATD